MVYLIVILLLAVADQALKFVIHLNIAPEQYVTVINNFFYIVNHRNTGAAWSFLANVNWGIYLLSAVSFVAVVAMAIIILRVKNHWLQTSLAIIAGGSLGNLIDRVRLRAVTDYLTFQFGSYVFPTFNLADMLIVGGTMLLVIVLLTQPELLDGPNVKKSEPADGAQ